MIKGLSLAALAIVAALAGGRPLDAQDGIAAAVNSIRADDVSRRIGVLAHDSMQGRDTPSPELEQTAQWIANEFRRQGLSPGSAEGTFIQRYPLNYVAADPGASFIAVVDGPTWRVGRDAGWLFGGVIPEPVHGSVVVISGTPRGPADFNAVSLEGAVAVVIAPMTADGELDNPAASRLLFGALQQRPAVVVAVTARNERSWSDLLERRRLLRPGERLPVGRTILDVPEHVIAPVLADYGFEVTAARADPTRPMAMERLDDLTISVTVTPRVVEQVMAPNVVAVLRGSDPDLADEYVLFSGHMDHVGVGKPVNGDSIYNGADDDASGTVAVIEAAEAFALLHPRPRRSMMFLTVSGEEKGLWGSEYFADHPPVPIDRIVADINTDMVGRNWRDTIVVIGKEHSDLGATLERVNAAHPELDMTAIDDLWPQERFYFRSDHYNFARKGVPILFFFNGTHPDYHQPSDEPDKIDAEKESRIVKLVFYLGLDIANRDERPRWDPNSYREIVEEKR